MNKPKPCLLMILDGWGIDSAGEGNAVHLARTPFLDKLADHLIRPPGCSAPVPRSDSRKESWGIRRLGI